MQVVHLIIVLIFFHLLILFTNANDVSQIGPLLSIWVGFARKIYDDKSIAFVMSPHGPMVKLWWPQTNVLLINALLIVEQWWNFGDHKLMWTFSCHVPAPAIMSLDMRGWLCCNAYVLVCIVKLTWQAYIHQILQ